MPVAVLGTLDFDVEEIDVETVRLEGQAPVHARVKDVATPFEGELCGCTAEGPDGMADLTLKFVTQEIVAALGKVTDGEERVLTLTGQLLDGTEFTADDCVVVRVPG